MTSDVRDILAIDDTLNKKQALLSKDTLLNSAEKKITRKVENLKRPRNIPRELWGLKDTFGGDFPSILPAPEIQIYKQPKALIAGKVRSWYWTPFHNSARQDKLLLYHWKRVDSVDKEKDYTFSRFNKNPVLPRYSQSEYDEHLDVEEWSKEETDYLMEMVEKYDMRFVVVHDRWEKTQYPVTRTLEDMKERYYMILGTLNNIRADNEPTEDPRYGPSSGWSISTDNLIYHTEHEKRRKRQLEKLMIRTYDQISEEEDLTRALNRIEILKRERQKKTMDLHKLLSQADFAIHGTVPNSPNNLVAIGDALFTDSGCNADANTLHQLSLMGGELARSLNLSLPPTAVRKKNATTNNANMLQTVGGSVVWEGLKFTDLSKSPGVHLRSAEMKLPASIGIKKTRFIEGLLNFFKIDINPTPTSDIIEIFNNLRGDILLIQELYATLSHLEYELCSYREKYQKLLDSGAQIDQNKAVPTCLTTPHIPFANSPSLQLGLGLQAAVRATEVKQKSATVITPLNVDPKNNSLIANGVTHNLTSPPGTRSSTAAATVNGIIEHEKHPVTRNLSHNHNHHRKRKQFPGGISGLSGMSNGDIGISRHHGIINGHRKLGIVGNLKKFRFCNDSSSSSSNVTISNHHSSLHRKEKK